MKLKNILVVFLCTFFIGGCSDNSITPKQNLKIVETTSSEQETTETQDRPVLNHRQFENLFNHMNSNLKIQNFKLKASTLGDDVTAIDKKLSFNKREWLTVDGTMDGTNLKSTQETLYFEDKDQTTQLSIHFAYTENYIGNDMVQYQINSGYNELNQKISNKSDLMIISYKNLIISVQQNTVNYLPLTCFAN
ncbi:hypothetical protein [Exiguobacterium qingdaonense]|uniref:hypothetical protein n=1 Tax=Exiguobacterium qingdaonense TaxID=2751251 RepID=UPI001BE8EA5D|nr:hypothetical protein [Exiguobacterium qingdaonense]